MPIYQPLVQLCSSDSKVVHHGICCDGPICNKTSISRQSYITGIRYKCTVCSDTDFCASCEASPLNQHNKTHPLIKLRSPIRHVSITTLSETEHGAFVQTLGNWDITLRPHVGEHMSGHKVGMNAGQTVVDAGFTALPEKEEEDKQFEEQYEAGEEEDEEEEEDDKEEDEGEEQHEEEQHEEEQSEEEQSEEQQHEEEQSEEQHTEQALEVLKTRQVILAASFVSDTIPDGTEVSTNNLFEQTWKLRNSGGAPWPAGCSVKFVGGDYMGRIDPSRPANLSELRSASESFACAEAVAPGDEFSFTVLLRAPAREGRFVSYWRISSVDGLKFGDRLWCEIQATSEAEKAAAKPVTKPVTEEELQPMVFPKMETESFVSSSDSESSGSTAPSEADVSETEVDAFEECEEQLDSWDISDDAFETDEEYDILDASDEEFVGVKQQQQQQQQMK